MDEGVRLLLRARLVLALRVLLLVLGDGRERRLVRQRFAGVRVDVDAVLPEVL